MIERIESSQAHNPPLDSGVKVTELKKFESLEDVERHFRMSLEGDRYKRKHPLTVLWIRSRLKPL